MFCILQQIVIPPAHLNCILLVESRVWARIWPLGDNLSPWLKFWGTFSFLKGKKFVHPSFLAGLLIGLGRKSQICGIFRDKFTEKSTDFAGVFGANFTEKQSVKKPTILWLFSRQISLEIDQFCADQISLFNVFLTEVIICSFNNNTLQKWTSGKAFNIMASAQFFAT